MTTPPMTITAQTSTPTPLPEKDSLGDRMKANYEDRYRVMLTRRMPVIVRLDGKAFHTFTRSFDRPFDQKLADAMLGAAVGLAGEAQGFKCAYLQSDECSILLTDYDDIQTQAWFDYNLAKIVSVSASCFTAGFNAIIGRNAMFDARAFNVPREEVSNYFLWRAKDWERNSVTMYAQTHFSHKELHGKGRADKHEMLHGIGKNWATDLSGQWRNGTWLVRGADGLHVRHDVLPTFADVDAVTGPLVNPTPPPEAP